MKPRGSSEEAVKNRRELSRNCREHCTGAHRNGSRASVTLGHWNGSGYAHGQRLAQIFAEFLPRSLIQIIIDFLRVAEM